MEHTGGVAILKAMTSFDPSVSFYQVFDGGGGGFLVLFLIIAAAQALWWWEDWCGKEGQEVNHLYFVFLWVYVICFFLPPPPIFFIHLLNIWKEIGYK